MSSTSTEHAKQSEMKADASEVDVHTYSCTDCGEQHDSITRLRHCPDCGASVRSVKKQAGAWTSSLAHRSPQEADTLRDIQQ